MYEVIIVGAGFSGLGAAHALKAAGVDNFLLLEARDRVGGRTRPGQLAGLDIDLGGMWLSPTQTRLKHFADHYAIGTYPTWLEGKGIFRLQGKTHHGSREKIDGLFSFLEGLDYLRAGRRLRKLSRDLDCEQPWQHRDAAELDATTVEQWLLQNVRSSRLRALFRFLCASVFCAEASQLSMLFFLHYLKAGDGLERIVSAGPGGAQNFLFHGGLHQIARHMADDLSGQLRLNSPVLDVQWSDNSAVVATASERFEARRLILALPPTLVPRLNFSPPLPRPKATLHERLNMGSAIKFWVAYDKPFWREQGFNGLIMQDDSPASPVMDVSPPDQPLGILAGFFDGDHAIDHGGSEQGERRGIVLDTLAEHFGAAARDPLDYLDVDWRLEQWSEGCYGAYAPPGLFGQYGALLRKPIGALHWACTESASRWAGYVDGAIRSGERAAEEVLAYTDRVPAP